MAISAEPPDNEPGAHERQARVATIRGFLLNRWMLGVCAAGVVVAIVFGVLTLRDPDAPPPSVSGSGGVGVQGDGNTVNVPSGNCAQVTGGNCTVQIQQAAQAVQAAASSAGDDDAELKKNLRQAPGNDQPPTGSAPYPFVVVDTANLGAFARDANTVKANRIGNAGNRALVWADCLATTDYTPGVTGDNAVGPLWLRIRWKPLPSGIDRGLSEPSEQRTAWMYRGFLEPVGHNGKIPAC
ncbi:hypothetical protein [Actinokineospora sp. NBRC 105648]|uniref:hypothetical protein n=1 Tax=Actinokineospora sp. NBRC 105648 TaxID=3032206 RepID=UPI002555392A|nr:hypothetical protein [Actinokineospora sp. NBRC 105648]